MEWDARTAGGWLGSGK
jgi:NAD dependent epimerase/dehydratase family enzyme